MVRPVVPPTVASLGGHRRLLRPRRASRAPRRAAWHIDPRVCQRPAPPEFHAPGCGFTACDLLE